MKVPIIKVLVDEIFKDYWGNRLPPEGLEDIFFKLQDNPKIHALKDVVSVAEQDPV